MAIFNRSRLIPGMSICEHLLEEFETLPKILADLLAGLLKVRGELVDRVPVEISHREHRSLGDRETGERPQRAATFRSPVAFRGSQVP